MKIKPFTILMIVLLSCKAFAEDDDTIVYGSAATKDNGQNVFIVEQPKDAPNPLGDPIPNQDKPVEVFGDVYPPNTNLTHTNNTATTSNTQNLGNDFENTLLEANDRVYDIQSYPKADFKAMENPAQPETIYSPNVNN